MKNLKNLIVIIILVLCILDLLELYKVNNNLKLVLVIGLLIVNIKNINKNETFSIYRSLNDNYIEDTGRIFYENPSNLKFSDKRQKLNILKGNKCSPDCCPSQYSCDRGCVCLNDYQKDLLYRRGGNKDITNIYL